MVPLEYRLGVETGNRDAWSKADWPSVQHIFNLRKCRIEIANFNSISVTRSRLLCASYAISHDFACF